MNPTTLHTDAQTVTLAIIAVVLPFAAFVLNKKMRTTRVAILGLFLSLVMMDKAASAQTRGRGVKRVSGSAKSKHTPLILVNGRFYNGDISKLNPNDIQNIKVLKYEAAKANYGSLATDGVLLIETKQRLNGDSVYRIDSVIVNKHPLFIVDGVPFNGRPDDVLVKDVGEIIAIKNVANEGAYINRADDGAIIIITRKEAIKQYQKKLSAFSKEYKDYLDTHKGDDTGLTYLMWNDGSVRQGSSAALTKVLYDLKDGDIKSISFSKRKQTATGWKPAIVGVELKTEQN